MTFTPYFCGETLDDVMRMVAEQILETGDRINPTKGEAREISGVLLEIRNPRARISLTETRGKAISCLGELCWYLAGTNKLEFIEYYIREYAKSADGDEIYGGYGPRLFQWETMNQFENVTNILRNNRDSRKAVIQIFDGQDILEEHKDVPCTCTLQFMVRGEKLNLLAHMRSNDAYRGLPHDVFCFTMLQEIMARTLSLDIGIYKHFVGSLHIYESNTTRIQEFLDEGWQPTMEAMPPMPEGEPWPQIERLLEAERTIRNVDGFDPHSVKAMEPYWADLARLLLIFRYKKDENTSGITQLREEMEFETFVPYINRYADLKP